MCPAVILSEFGVHVVEQDDPPVIASLAGNPVEILGENKDAFIVCKVEPEISTFVGATGSPNMVILDSGALVFGVTPGEVPFIERAQSPAEALKILQKHRRREKVLKIGLNE